MDTEPSLGELMRGMAELRRAIEQLAGRVLTIEVWRAEREALEYRLREVEKDLASVEAARRSDNERRALDRRAVFTAVVAPVAVAIILALGAVAIQLYAATRP